jgi:WhiB family redox-sensing transcriptional regulator
VTLDWMQRANCAGTDPEVFFPDGGGSVAQAKRVCVRCDVIEECGEYAVDEFEVYGVWGGLSQQELGRIRRARRIKCRHCGTRFPYRRTEQPGRPVQYCGPECRTAARATP